MPREFLFSLCLLSVFLCQSQKERKESIFRPYSVALHFGYGTEDNFAFNDKDYSYQTNFIKATFYYPINQRKYQLGLSIQPQIHFLEHQLLNEQFVRPHEVNFQQLRDRFTRSKSMKLYAMQAELSLSKKITGKLSAIAFLAVGPAIIDTETERLSKGFTFIENIGFGIHYAFNEKWFLIIKPNYNHVSNAQLLERNSGYNALNIEFGLGFQI